MSPTPPPLPNTTSPPTQQPANVTYFVFFGNPNNTYYTDEEEQETGYSEMETVALACFLTLLPLIVGVISYFSIRTVWLRWRRTVEPSELSKPLDKEASERSKSARQVVSEPHTQRKAGEGEISVAVEGEEAGAGSNQTSKLAANGSIITMTMKNNHLIVETEERLESGVAVEGEAERGEKSEEVGLPVLEEVVVAAAGASEESPAIVHVNNKLHEDTDYQGVTAGQSTSDLSSSSDTAAPNRGYRYGNQEEYSVETEELERQCAEVGAAKLPGLASSVRPSFDATSRSNSLVAGPSDS